MNLDELRAAIESDAKARADAQEQTIKRLNRELRIQYEWHDALEKRIEAMMRELRYGEIGSIRLPFGYRIALIRRKISDAGSNL